MLTRFFICIFTIAATSFSGAEELALTLKFDKTVYHVGDEIRCTMQFTNMAKHTIRLLPVDTFIPARELEFRLKASSAKPTVLSLVDNVDDEALAKKAVTTLKPGESYVLKVQIFVYDHFREIYHDNRQGLILDFPASALLLPSFGQYEVRRTFRAKRYPEIDNYLPPGLPLWVGVVSSPPVILEFRP